MFYAVLGDCLFSFRNTRKYFPIATFIPIYIVAKIRRRKNTSRRPDVTVNQAKTIIV